jgi:transcriptional regulator NrdR family protein
MLDSSSVGQTITVNYVLKRNGSTETFDKDKISTAVAKAMKSIGIKSKTLPEKVASEVTLRLYQWTPFTDQ